MAETQKTLSGHRRHPAQRMRRSHGFTLIEVMLAMAVLGIAMLALLALHHQSLQSVIHSQDITRAAQLAQAVMSAAELERYPNPGTTKGNFQTMFPNEYPNFSWEQIVSLSGMFPDVRKVQVIVHYGPKQSKSFSLTEFMHDPLPLTGAPGAPPMGVMAPTGVAP